MSVVQYHKMNTGWTDASGNGYDGTPSGAIINNVDQKLGAGCGEFDGLNDKITFPTYFNMEGISQLSLSAWIKHDTGATKDGIFGMSDGAQKNLALRSAQTGEGLMVWCGSGQSWGEVLLDISSTWRYVNMVFDGDLSGNANRLKVYVGSVCSRQGRRA